MTTKEEIKKVLRSEVARLLRSLADWVEAGGVERALDSIRDRVHRATAPSEDKKD